MVMSSFHLPSASRDLTALDGDPACGQGGAGQEQEAEERAEGRDEQVVEGRAHGRTLPPLDARHHDRFG